MLNIPQRVLVSGAAGSIGSALVKRLSRQYEVIALDQDETGVFELLYNDNFSKFAPIPVIADIRDRDKMAKVFKKHKPEKVYHAAAYKHVPLMEAFPDEAVKTNVIGTVNVAELCAIHGIKKMVLISSDKAVNPTSVMGMTKRVAEIICQSYQYVAVRFGNVLASRGSVVPIFNRQIAKGGPITITHPDMKRYFMGMFEAIELVIAAGEIGKSGEIMVLDMGEPIKIIDLARIMINLSGKDIPIQTIGIRPGEKMFEEIMTHKESLDKTLNKNIFIMKPQEIDYDKLRLQLGKLECSLDRGSEKVVELLKEVVNL